jgi:hypothetical protein
MDLNTDLVPTLPNGASVLPTIFQDGATLERVLVQIEERALSETFDMSDEASRKACASLAHKVSRSKTAIAEIGDKQAAELRAGWDVINVHRRMANDRLDHLRDTVKAPLDAWKTAEKERIAAHEDRITALRAVLELRGEIGTEAIREHLEATRCITVSDDWEEFRDEAVDARMSAIEHLSDILAEALDAEAAEAELAQLRREKIDREKQDQIDAEQREREARDVTIAAMARKEAEAKAARALEAERDRAELEVREAKLRADEVVRDAAAAVDRERAEVAAREKTEAEARAKREADEEHRIRVETSAARAITTTAYLNHENSMLLVRAIADGQIPHVTITY